MRGKLSPFQQEALARARAAGGLEYVRGGYWAEKGTDHEAFLRAGWNRPHWHASTGTVRALERRGLLVAARLHPRDGYVLEYAAAEV